MFGILSTFIDKLVLPTLEDFYGAVRQAFKTPDLKVEAIPVNVIPDYSFLEDHVDPCLSRLHKGVQTQHQWRFEACEKNALFPRGCKTTYRAYSSAQVIEIEEKPRLGCLSAVGRLTGLEPWLLHVRDYPAKDTYTDNICPERKGVEGFYLLRNDIGLPNFPPEYVPPPFRFPCSEKTKLGPAEVIQPPSKPASFCSNRIP